MKEKLETLLNELYYLKNEGVDSVYYEDASLDELKAIIKESVIDNPKELAVPETLPKPSHSQRLNPFSPLPQDSKVTKIKTIEKNPNTLKKGIKAELQTTTESIAHIDLPPGSKQTQWNYLKEKAINCNFSNKGTKPGSKIVFGTGSLEAEVFFCGDAPGVEEEAAGLPFAGKSGQLLNKIIQAMGLHREQVYIANIINWLLDTPTHSAERTPTQKELLTSLPYLKAQLEIIKPKVLVALGATTVNGLLGPDKSRKMGEVRGKWFSFQNTPLMITFHPSYLIQNNTTRAKRLVWEDMLEIITRLSLPISEKQQSFFK